jgi:hypothetical protein
LVHHDREDEEKCDENEVIRGGGFQAHHEVTDRSED